MGLRTKKSLVDQAIDQANDVVDALRPHVESAYGQARDFVQDTAIPALADARDTARDKAGPVLVDARDKAVPVLVDARDTAREKAAPLVADARAKAVPLVASGAALAGEKATAARALAEAKVAQVKGEEPQKRSKIKTLLVLTAVTGGIAVAAKKLQGGAQKDNWQSSYTPKPATPAPTSTTTHPVTGSPLTSSPAASPAASPVVDPGGAGPDEAIADAVDAPHPVTTPDEPAEVVHIDPDASR